MSPPFKLEGADEGQPEQTNPGEKKKVSEVKKKKDEAALEVVRAPEGAPIRRPKQGNEERTRAFMAEVRGVEKKKKSDGKGGCKKKEKQRPKKGNPPKVPPKEKEKEKPKQEASKATVPTLKSPPTISKPESKPAGGTKKAATVEGKPAANSPAQNISDDNAWDEISPMMGDLLAEEAKTAISLNQGEVFRIRCERGPFAAVVKGRFLAGLKIKEQKVNDLAQRALAVSTVKAHKRMLRFLSRIPQKYQDLNLDRALEQYFLDMKREKRWLPTTMVVKMATAHGALRLLPLYAEGELPVLMRESPLWMSAMKAAAKMAKQHPPVQPTAATWKEVEAAISKETDTAVRMALLLTWLTCGRGGDVLLLKPGNVELTDRETKGGKVRMMSVGFWKGKTVKTRGSYTVFTQPPPPTLLEEWKAYQKSAEGSNYLFKGVRGSQIKDALRRANPKLEQRSLRRGAIQALAATGLKDEELLHYSGHTNVTMLRRYLNFGKVSGEGTRLASQALALVQ